jgi:ubiquinone/menaquinone biosynthesis C-methylase UbiE
MSHSADAVAFFDQHAEHYSKGYSRTSINLYDDWYSSRRLRTVLRHLASVGKPARYADVGCGSGEVTEAVMECIGNVETAAIDLSSGMLDVFRRRTSRILTFHQADAADTGLPTEHFDLVTSIGVLPYLPDPGRGVAEIARLLKAGGHAVITYPIKNTPMRFFRDTRIGRFIKSRLLGSGLYEVRWSFEQFRHAVQENGLTIRKTDSLWPSEFCVTAQKN